MKFFHDNFAYGWLLSFEIRIIVSLNSLFMKLVLLSNIFFSFLILKFETFFTNLWLKCEILACRVKATVGIDAVVDKTYNYVVVVHGVEFGTMTIIIIAKLSYCLYLVN